MQRSDREIWDHRVRVERTAALGAERPPSRDPALRRVRHGVYAPAAALAEARRGVHYLARIEATALRRTAPVFARESALAIHGIPYGAEPERVFTTGDLRTAGLKAGVQHSRVELDPRDIVAERGFTTCSLPYALADLARHREQRVAVAAIDAALHESRTTRDEILAALGRQGPVGRARAEGAIRFADGRAESVGESWSRVAIQLLGFAAPELQPIVQGSSGRSWRPDMRWSRDGRRPLLGEFDGAEKYGSLVAAPGAAGAAALADEKAREDDLRIANDVARWVWRDVLQPHRLERILLAHAVPRTHRPGLWLPR